MSDYLTDYDAFVAETAIFPPERGISYCMKKLSGEIGETLDKLSSFQANDFEITYGIMRELGDVIWYVSAFAQQIGTSLKELYDTTWRWNCSDNMMGSAVHLAIAVGSINEAAGKLIRDKGADDSNTAYLADADFKDIVANALVDIVSIVRGIAMETKSSFDTVLDVNMEKLLSRRARGKLQGSGDNR